MKKYEKYQVTGSEWFEEIPEQWEIRRLATLGMFSKGNGIKKDEILECGKPCIRYGEIYTKYDRIVNIPISFISEETSHNCEKILKGDILFTGSGETAEDIGKSLVYMGEEECFAGGDIIILRLKKAVDPVFLSYIMNCHYVVTQKSIIGKGEIIVHIYSKDLKELILVMPPLSDQNQIVKYLDQKTSIIENLIQQKFKKIELLKEHRTSIINQAVTKGLNSEVKMKDSGVEWIGNIPSHWKFVKVGHYTSVVRGGSPRPAGDPRFFEGDFIHWITVKEITSKEGKYITNTESMLTEEGMKQSRVLESETLVLSNSGATLGVPGILKIRGCINDGSVAFVRISQLLKRDFLFYFWLTQTDHLREQQSGFGQPNLNIEIVANVKFPLPPVSEQIQIVEYLDKKTSEIDKQVDLENRKIDLLKEYRQSLISEVVTGKIDVRTN